MGACKGEMGVAFLELRSIADKTKLATNDNDDRGENWNIAEAMRVIFNTSFEVNIAWGNLRFILFPNFNRRIVQGLHKTESFIGFACG